MRVSLTLRSRWFTSKLQLSLVLILLALLPVVGVGLPRVAAAVQLASDPACTTSGVDHIDCFGRGSDNALWHIYWSGSGGWSSWESLGGSLASSPAVVLNGAQHYDVFARGTDNALWHIYWDFNGGWSSWESLGGTLTSDPVLVSWSPNRIDLFARGSDDALWHIYYVPHNYDQNTGGWSSWESLGGTLTSDPAAISWGPNRIDVFTKGSDNALWHTYWDIRLNNGGWGSWESL